jgi:hypothetical protein
LPPGAIEQTPPSKLRIASWVGVASTVALVTAGAIFGLAAQSRGDEISRRFLFVDSSGQPHKYDPTQRSDYENLKSDGAVYNGLAIGFFTAAAAAAVATTVMFVVDVKRAKKQVAHLLPQVAGRKATLDLGWSF